MTENSEGSRAPKSIEPVEAPWPEGIVLVCSKCSQRLGPPANAPEESPSERIKRELKKQLHGRGFHKRLRVVTSSCLDICPEKGISVAFVPQGAGQRARAYVVAPDVESPTLAEILLGPLGVPR